jgi:anti-anti-sigma factor
MTDQQTCTPPVIVTLPAQLDAATADQAADQITAAFTPGVRVVITDLTAAACCDCSAIRNLLKAHRKATARGGQVRFAIRPGGPLHQITDFGGTHPLLAVYPTLRHALTGRSSIPLGNRAPSPAAAISPAPSGAARRAATAAMTASRIIRTRGQMALARRSAACDRRAWRAAP